MQVERYLGEQREPAGGAAEPMSPHDERRWSVVAHLSVLAGLMGLAPFGALVVWLLYKDRSPRVRFHVLQMFWYQLAWIVVFTVYVLATVFLSIVTLGAAALVLVPLAFVLAVAPLAHWCYAAYRVNGGVDYRYPFIADRIDSGTRRIF